MQFRQALLCKISAISVGQDTGVALSRQEGDHALFLVFLSSLLWKEIQQLMTEREGGGGGGGERRREEMHDN